MQQKLTLVIGSKARSSWSLRPWLFLRHHEVPFEEILIALNQNDSRARILDHSPSGKLPCLLHGSLRVWESLAICEYAAETLALPLAWPLDPAARAMARAMTAEMHAGFAEMRRELPFDALRAPAPQAHGEKAQEEVQRIRALWREARTTHGRGGPWLFGKFGIVDAMFAPVALRFHGYALPLEGAEREYMYHVLMHPAVQAWLDAAALEVPVEESTAQETQESAAERTSEIAVAVAEPVAPTPPSSRYVDDPDEALEMPPSAADQRDAAAAPAPTAASGPKPAAAADPTKLKSIIMPP